MKKILSTLLLMLVPYISQAQDITTVDGLKYVVDLVGGVDCYVYSPVDKNLTTANIPDKISYNGKEYNVTEIVSKCFRSCYELMSVSIPSSVTKLGDECFANCTKLKSISIPSSISKIPNSCFSGCTGLSLIELPSNITELGVECFAYCSFESIKLPESLKSTDYYVFNSCQSLKEVILPDEFENLGYGTFAYCKSLESVKIPNGLKKISPYCFINCEALKHIELPEYLTEIGEQAFNGCEALREINLPKFLTSLGESCFFGCNSLVSVEIPSSVKEMGHFCFQNCAELKEIILHSDAVLDGTIIRCPKFFKMTVDCPDIPKIGQSTWPRVFGETLYDTIGYLYVPSELIDKYRSTEIWKEWKNILPIDGGGQGGETVQKCSDPVINIDANGISFSCDTEGVVFHYSVVYPENIYGEGESLNVNSTIKVSVYASKNGFQDSDIVEKEILSSSLIQGDTNGDGVINAADVVKLTDIIMNQK